MDFRYDINTEQFQSGLLRWFQSNGRNLPWRQEYNPYHVWLSEIMLQQTQMDRGVAYLERWLKRFPDIASVARASSYEILKYWEGLGYYARARNLHKAAKAMVARHGGEVPQQYDDLLSLPGIGPYTASAVASIAYNADFAVVDANVERIFSRIFDISRPLKEKQVKQEINALAARLLPAGQARNFNQALMDLGGLVCTPKAPDCGVCPVSRFCQAYKGNFVGDRPVKTGKKEQIHIEMATAMLVKNGHVFIQQRHDDDIWGGLWEFPGGRLKQNEMPEQTVVREYAEETGFRVEVCEKITTVTHFYTKYKVTLHCFTCRLLGESLLPDLQEAQKYHWVDSEELDNFAFPAGHRKFLEYLRQHRHETIAKEC